MEIVNVRDAVGMALCHDITQIVPNKFKGRLFKRGHIITEDDVSKLLDVGKEHIYVWNLKKGYVHENDAAFRIAKAVAGQGLSLTEPKEGKIEFIADVEGLLKVDKELLSSINSIENIAVATLHGNHSVSKGKRVAGTRIIPLVIENKYLTELESLCNKPVIEILPFKKWKIGLIITGSEVYAGRIKDGFGPVIEEKVSKLNSEIMEKTYVPDSVDMTVQKIHDLKSKGAEMIILTGGMSVDPDDLTPSSIRAAGGKTIIYGTPVFPGAMFMLAYIDDVPVVGLPGCVMYHKASIFDLVIPRIIAGEKIDKKFFSELGYGGFCQQCEECHYPNCSYGKI
ncbi:MAG: molybdopterin-binding protein [Anaerovoracaceae bacterium]|jgi:hypothetical protein